MRAELIVWTDHGEPPGAVWWDVADMGSLKLTTHHTIGYVVHENEELVAVSGTRVTDDGQVSRPFLIGKAMIVSRTKVKLPG